MHNDARPNLFPKTMCYDQKELADLALYLPFVLCESDVNLHHIHKLYDVISRQ